MKLHIYIISLFFPVLLFNSATAQNIGVGEHHPGSKLSVKGGIAVGNNYSTLASPSDGMIIEGPVGIGTTTPDTNAVIDMRSSGKGVLLPRMSSAQRNAIQNPANGLLVFDEDAASFFYFSSKENAWINMSAIGKQNPGASSATGSPLVFTTTKMSVAADVTYNNLNTGNASIIKFIETSGAGDFKVAGIAAGIDGQIVILRNDAGNKGDLIIEEMNKQTVIGNRIAVPSTSDNGQTSTQKVAAGKSITLMYNGDEKDWEVVGWGK